MEIKFPMMLVSFPVIGHINDNNADGLPRVKLIDSVTFSDLKSDDVDVSLTSPFLMVSMAEASFVGIVADTIEEIRIKLRSGNTLLLVRDNRCSDTFVRCGYIWGVLA